MGNFIDATNSPRTAGSDYFTPGSTDRESDGHYSFPMQFTVGDVMSSITNPRADGCYGDVDMNSILAIKNSDFKRETSKDLTMLKNDMGNHYKPLLRGIQDVPTKGDPVLLCQFEGVGYYLGPLNTFGNPNFNPDVGLPAGNSVEELRSKLFMNPKFEWNPGYKRLQKAVLPELDRVGGKDNIPDDEIPRYGVGDMMLEGRFGNSIRVGQRGRNPLIIISNGRRLNNTTETLSDGNTIFLSKSGTLSDHWRLPFYLYSNLESLKNNRVIEFEDRSRHQMYFDSNTIIFNAKGDGGTEDNPLDEGILMSSYSNIRFGVGDSFEVSTKNHTLIDSSNIYFGRSAMDSHKEGNPTQPMVLGEELRVLLLEMVELLETFKVTGCVAGLSGPPAPDVLSKIASLKNSLSREMESKFESKYHFIETNDTEK